MPLTRLLHDVLEVLFDNLFERALALTPTLLEVDVGARAKLT